MAFGELVRIDVLIYVNKSNDMTYVQLPRTIIL